MADSKLTEQQVADLATILRSDKSLDSKVQYVTNIKSGIKQHNVPDNCVALLFDGLRSASTSQHAALVNAGFTALNHLLTRLSRQEPKHLIKEAPRTLPVIIDKFGDLKEKYRSLAAQALNTLYAVVPTDVERSVRNSAMAGKNARAKEAAMHWLLQTHKEQGLQFRSYVPSLMELLEDADGMVRDTAKTTVIELFRNAPGAAKSDLKRQLKNFKVRPAIEQAIVKALAPASSRPETPSEPATAAAPPPKRTALGASVSSASSERPTTPALDMTAEAVDPMYVNTTRELDDIFKEMAWCFESKETEQNWVQREQSMNKLRKLNAGNASTDFRDTFLTGVRAMLDGVIKAVNSLRTSLSKEGCGLVQEIAVTHGPGIDPMVEILMQTFLKLSAGTKKISSQNANLTVDIIISRVTYNVRLMQHVWSACQDKNVQPRTYATGWLKTILKREAHHKSHVEHSGGVDLMEKCIKKGLADANPAVREKMRSTFWAFHSVWTQRANAIMDDLDTTAQKLLNKDPSNPNSPKKTDSARPAPTLSRSTNTASKPSLRETMMAQKRANLAAKNLPARPGSAMAHISPVRTTSNSHTTSSSASAKPSGTTSRTRPESNTISVNAGGMSVAPMRPNRRRPEIAPRPATAGPYSVRDQPASMEAESPETLRAKATATVGAASRANATTPKRTAPRSRPGHASHASESSVVSPSARAAANRVAGSPRVTPAKLKQTQSAHPSSTPSKTSHEDTALAAPITSSLQTVSPQEVEEPVAQNHEEPVVNVEESPAHPSPPVQDPPSQPSPEVVVSPAPVVPEISPESPAGTPSKPLKVFEDPFVEQEPTSKTPFTGSVLEDRPVNEDAAILHRSTSNGHATDPDTHMQHIHESPEKTRQNSRLLDSGIAKIKTKTLEVHGFRKLQSLIRDSKTLFTDDKFEALVLGLFQYLQDPLDTTAPSKAQDVKAQILATLRLLLRKEKDNFQPFVSRGLECLLQTRSGYDSRAHVVSALELLADNLVTIGDSSEIVVVLTRRLQDCTDSSVEGCRMLSMGLHVLKELLLDNSNSPANAGSEIAKPTESELAQLASLAGRCLDSADSGVRMDAVQLCVALHERVAEPVFWNALSGVKDDPKSLITYYIVKRQREQGLAPQTS